MTVKYDTFTKTYMTVHSGTLKKYKLMYLD